MNAFASQNFIGPVRPVKPRDWLLVFTKPEFIRWGAAGISTENLPQTNIERIARGVARYYGLSVGDLRSRAHKRKIAHPRQIAFYLADTHHATPRAQIGRWFRRDHATVIYGIREVKKRLLAGDQATMEVLADLRSFLGPLEGARHMPNHPFHVDHVHPVSRGGAA